MGHDQRDLVLPGFVEGRDTTRMPAAPTGSGNSLIKFKTLQILQNFGNALMPFSLALGAAKVMN